MNKQEIEKALRNGTLVWNDPEPIEGADYRVQTVVFYGKDDEEELIIDTVMINYGGGSEAEVYKTELVDTAGVELMKPEEFDSMEVSEDIKEISIEITNKLIEMGYVKDCTDTDDEDEFEVQDMIREVLYYSKLK